nr:ribonuclease H [Tanacetum cinerariifolium]
IQSKEAILQVVYDVLRNSPPFRAFQVTADVPEIYMQEFWASAKLDHHSIHFKIDARKSVLDLEAFREMLHISPRIPNQQFAYLPTEEEVLDFLSDDDNDQEETEKVNDDDDDEEEISKIGEQEVIESDESDDEATESDRESMESIFTTGSFTDSSVALTAFVDADHAGCQDTRRSTSGSVQFLRERLISWSSKRYHFIKEKVENGVIELYFVNTEYQLADLFTKALGRDRIEFLTNKLGMRSFTHETLKKLMNEEDE